VINRRGGNPFQNKTSLERDAMVYSLIGLGFSKAAIARVLMVSPNCIDKYFRRECSRIRTSNIGHGRTAV
jgi:DNA-binding NarL/FixJ family response regulator